MADASISLTVSVNADDKRIYLYENNSDNSFWAQEFTSTAINDAFFEQLCRVLLAYKQSRPYLSLENVSLVLPDRFFLTDMLTVPNLGKKAAGNSLNLVIGTVYKNKNELAYNTFPLFQNKQTMVFGMVGARKAFLNSIRHICQKNAISVKNITFAANSMANAAMALNPKVRTGAGLLMDIQETYTRFAFLNKGRTLGAYTLPFGYSILYKSRLADEEQLFDYASAELLVINAKEKARAKRLTVMTDEDLNNPNPLAPQPGAPLNAEGNEPEEEVVENLGGRKLPKFMLRQIPVDAQGFVFENFRIFVKWALELLCSNTKITALESVETVYVNMPGEYAFLFDMVNREEKENGVTFSPLLADNALCKPLELFGGFFVKQYNKLNNF